MSAEATPNEVIDIHIDRKPYQARSHRMNGGQLRRLAGLGTDVLLYKEEFGDVEDVEISDDDAIELKAGEHFYSTPRTVTPGHE